MLCAFWRNDMKMQWIKVVIVCCSYYCLVGIVWGTETRILNSNEIHMYSYPVDYGGMHPFEIMRRNRRRQQEQQEEEEEEFVENKRENTNERLLQNEGNNDDYENMRFEFNTERLESYVEENPEASELIEFIKKEVAPEAAAFWSSALRVFPANRIDLRSDLCIQLDEIQGPTSFENADMIVFVDADEGPCFDATGEPTSTLGFARPCQLDQFFRPIVGEMTVCTAAFDLNDEESRTLAVTTFKHEFAHMLGFTSGLLVYWHDPLTGLPRTETIQRKFVVCADGIIRNVFLPDENTIIQATNARGAISFEIVTPTVQAIVRNQFDCSTMEGARLENQPTSSDECFGSHWDMRLFSADIMAAVTQNDAQILTPLTLAFFEDSGWYRANYNISSISPFGHGSGCDFVTEDCIVAGTVPSYSEGFFCAVELEYNCDITHTRIVACSVGKFNIPLPEEYQYFSDPTIGGTLAQRDYCPAYTVQIITSDRIDIDCTNSELESINRFGETYGSDSRCFNIVSASEEIRPYCFRSRCNTETNRVEIFLGDIVLSCENDGEILTVPWAGVKVACPRLAQMCPDLICEANCAGRGECDYSLENPTCACNDPFDDSSFCANSPTFKLRIPTVSPSPSQSPSSAPTEEPTIIPTSQPSISPQPSSSPSIPPSSNPSSNPSLQPSMFPVTTPSDMPSISSSPSLEPTNSPMPSISLMPSTSFEPSPFPTSEPSPVPTLEPSPFPTVMPSPGISFIVEPIGSDARNLSQCRIGFLVSIVFVMICWCWV